MTQNAVGMRWGRAEVDSRLREIMQGIHDRCVEYGRTEDGYVDYVRGASIAGFVEVANAMVDYGVV